MHGSIPDTLFHYTTQSGLQGILESQTLKPSLLAVNPADARYGDGQYFSDIIPGTLRPSKLSLHFLNIPYQGRRFTHYVEIDVTSFAVLKGRDGVFVVPNSDPLDLTGRIISSGWVM